MSYFLHYLEIEAHGTYLVTSLVFVLCTVKLTVLSLELYTIVSETIAHCSLHILRSRSKLKFNHCGLHGTHDYRFPSSAAHILGSRYLPANSTEAMAVLQNYTTQCAICS